MASPCTIYVRMIGCVRRLFCVAGQHLSRFTSPIPLDAPVLLRPTAETPGAVERGSGERTSIMSEIELNDLLKAGVHFGHQMSRWHPKMRPFIFASRAGIYIVDLEKTAEQLKHSQTFVRDRAAAGG